MYDFLFQRGRLHSGVQSGLCRREHSIRCRDPGFSPSVKQLPFTFEIDFVKWHHENGTRKLELKESIPRLGYCTRTHARSILPCECGGHSSPGLNHRRSTASHV